MSYLNITSGVQDLRPIGLIAETRKIRTRLVIGLIKKLVLKRKRLQPDHSGGVPYRGTDTVILQMLNLFEEATAQRAQGTEENQNLHLDFMFWVTQKAFDSVDNHAQYLAWRRLGIPPKIAKWIVSLDLKGYFIPLGPHRDRITRRIKMEYPLGTHHHQVHRIMGFTHARSLL